MDNYNTLERPVTNEPDPLEVKFGLTLQQIIDMEAMSHDEIDICPHFVRRKICNYKLKELIEQNNGDLRNVSRKLLKDIFFKAVTRGAVEDVKSLFKYYPSMDVNVSDKYSKTALHYTVLDPDETAINISSNRWCYRSHKSECDDCMVLLIKFLLKRGAKINHQSEQGVTALQAASGKGLTKIVKVLLENNADPNIASSDYCRETALHLAIMFGHLDVVKMLLENGANPDTKLSTGMNPLYLAIRRSQIEILKVLLEYSANVHDTTDCRKTSLHMAAFRSPHAEVTEEIIKAGGIIDSIDINGRTPLHLASMKNRTLVVDCLLKYGCDVNIIDKFGHTPIMTAMSRSNTVTPMPPSVDENIPQQSPDVARILRRHLIKLKAAGFYLNEKNLLWLNQLNREDLQYKADCEREVNHVKFISIPDTRIRLYDILMADLKQMTAYTRNHHVVKFMESELNGLDLNIYFDIMSRQFKKGSIKRDLIDHCLSVIVPLIFSDLPKLPLDCYYNILSRFSDSELKLLKTSFSNRVPCEEFSENS